MKLKLFNKNIFELNIGKKENVAWSFGQAVRYLFADRDGEVINIGNAFEKHVWVYVCVNVIARNLAQIPFKIYKKGSDKELKGGYEYELFKNINPYMDKYMFWEGITIYKQITGNAFIYLVKAGKNTIQEFGLLDSSKMDAVIDDTGVLVGWRYGGKQAIATDEVIQLKYFNPHNLYKGLSPLKTAIESVQIDDYARRFNKAVLKNGSFPGGVIEVERSLDDVQYTRAKQDFENLHKGVDKAGKIALLEGGAKYKELRITPEELQYIEQRKLSKDEIHAIYGVPIAMTGDTSSFNRANMNDIKKEFLTKKIIPELKSYEETINSQLFDKYFKGLEGRFDLSVLLELQDEYSLKIAMAKDLFLMGFTRNEINKKLNLGFEDKVWGDTWFIPFGQVPVEQVLEGNVPEQNQQEAPPKEEETPEKMINKLEKFIKSNVNIKRHYMIWKGLINKVNPIEKEYKKKLSRFMFELRQDILNSFFDKQTKGIKLKAQNDLFNVSFYKNKLKKMSELYLSDAMKKGGDALFSEVNLQGQFDLANQDTIRMLQNQIDGLSEIIDTLDKQTIEIIKKAVESGATNDEIANMLRDMMDIAGNRSKVVARTEIMSAANSGRFLAYDQANIEQHEWIDSFDDRVRDIHRLSGEIVDVGREFKNGLKYPGDRTGSGSSPENIIGCR